MILVKYFLLICIRMYQLTFSYFIGRQCRFNPTCSAYAYASISEHGVRKGVVLALKRLSKCHPWGTTNDDNAGHSS